MKTILHDNVGPVEEVDITRGLLRVVGWDLQANLTTLLWW